MGDANNEPIISDTVPESTRMMTRGSSAPLVENVVISVSENDNVDSDLSLTVQSGSSDSIEDVIPKSIEEDRMNDIGDGGDSDVEGDEYEIHKRGVSEICSEREDDAIEVDELDARGEFKDIVDLTGTGGMNVIGKISVASEEDRELQGKYKDVKIYRAPDDWTNPPAKPERGEPNFDDVDNPGAWPPFIFSPTFASRGKTSKYKHHALPTGCVPVPVNEDGN